MRVIGGKLKGRRIAPPKGLPIRPTTDRTKESLFNILQNRLELDELDVIDLFAGSGGIGLEFLSRGAQSLQFVDACFKCCSFIEKTLKEFNLGEDGKVSRERVERFLVRNKKEANLVFADPPYDYNNLEGLVDLCLNSRSMKEGSLFILEHINKIKFGQHSSFIEDRTYGQSIISIFRKTDKQ